MDTTNNEKFVNFVSTQETKASVVTIAEFDGESIVLTIKLLQNIINEMKLRLFDKHKLINVDDAIFKGVEHKVYADGQKRMIESLDKVIKAGDNFYVDKYKLSNSLKNTLATMADPANDDYKKVFGTMTENEETTMVRFIILLNLFEEANKFVTKFYEAFDNLEKARELFVELQKK